MTAFLGLLRSIAENIARVIMAVLILGTFAFLIVTIIGYIAVAALIILVIGVVGLACFGHRRSFWSVRQMKAGEALLYFVLAVVLVVASFVIMEPHQAPAPVPGSVEKLFTQRFP